MDSAARLGFAAMAMLSACGRSDKTSLSDTAVTRSNATSVSVATAPHASPCPATGLWAVCSIEKRLKSAGMVAKKINGEGPPHAGFTVAPSVYSVGRGSRLELFIYPDHAALSRDMSALDTLTVAPRGTKGSWSSAPTLIRSANLAAVLITPDAREAERLSLALEAGAPQPVR